MSIEAMKMALEALELFCECGTMDRPIERREALRQAIEQAEKQEPMPDDLIATYEKGFQDGQSKREWVGLTDEETKEAWESGRCLNDVAKIIEAKLKEKNT